MPAFLPRFKERSVLPGFGLSFGFTMFYLSILVLLPCSTLFWQAGSGGWEEFKSVAFSPNALSSYRVTFLTSFAAATINLFSGLLVAWVLARYAFPGKSIVDALIDMPFALPTSVGGLALTTVYSKNGILGRYLYKVFVYLPHFESGFHLTWVKTQLETSGSLLGITIALTFISFPFIVRTVQPVLQELDAGLEEAAASLGADRWMTFRRVIFPYVFPALLTGYALGFARAIGEYGSVVFIASNRPGKSQIAPLLIAGQAFNGDYAGATGIAVVLLLASFVLLLSINGLQEWSRRRMRG